MPLGVGACKKKIKAGKKVLVKEAPPPPPPKKKWSKTVREFIVWQANVDGTHRQRTKTIKNFPGYSCLKPQTLKLLLPGTWLTNRKIEPENGSVSVACDQCTKLYTVI